ncbi:MAG: prepilin peptidase [Atopobiaceae bacterium]|nr:prepilin peptidase [Atopobiaceae bacterium]
MGWGLSSRLLLACAWSAVGWRYGITLQAAELCMLCLVLLTVTLTDMAERVIPDECLLAALGARGFYLILSSVNTAESLPSLVLGSLVGGACAFVPLLAMALVTDWLTGTRSLGGGDLKLLTVVGCYVGSTRLPLVLLAACLLALIWAVLPVLRHGPVRRTFAFGPSIALAVLVVLVAVPHVEGWLASMAI